jgi:hypothetical protein
MPELNDPLADLPRGDPPRLPKSDRVHAELQERMERLPPGHPSSPYNDNGTRKPPPLDLSDYELPIPGDPEYQSDIRASEADPPSDGSQDRVDEPGYSTHENAADEQRTTDSETDRPLDAEAKPRLHSDGSWKWNDRTLTPEESRSADQALARWFNAEGRDAEGNYGDHGLTPAMRRIESQLEYGELVPDTEKFALKGADRLKLKLAERINLQPGESADALLSRIHDGIRYTFEYDDHDYAIGIEETEGALEGSGYELITRKPSWDSPDYKGVNSQWRDPDSGQLFEVQFHTHASWDAKQRTHTAYESLVDPRTTPEERERLDDYQKKITASVPIPLGALDIPYYHKKDA